MSEEELKSFKKKRRRPETKRSNPEQKPSSVPAENAVPKSERSRSKTEKTTPPVTAKKEETAIVDSATPEEKKKGSVFVRLVRNARKKREKKKQEKAALKAAEDAVKERAKKIKKAKEAAEDAVKERAKKIKKAKEAAEDAVKERAKKIKKAKEAAEDAVKERAKKIKKAKKAAQKQEKNSNITTVPEDNNRKPAQKTPGKTEKKKTDQQDLSAPKTEGKPEKKKTGNKQQDKKNQTTPQPPSPPPVPEKKIKKQIILNCEELENRSALLCDGRLEEYELERPSNEIVAGSIYLGRITRLEPSLEAAFVDIGAEKNAFLHYRDMLPASYDILEDVRKAESENGNNQEEQSGKLLSKFAGKIRSLIGKADKTQRLKELEEKLHSGKIKIEDIPKVFPCGSELLVQVTKGPIGTKGARVTTNITIPGRYLVLLPYSKHIGLSSKIEDHKERTRLRNILTNLDIPDNMGMICRTVGEGRKEIFFRRDLDMLLEVWHSVETALIQPKAPALVYAEPTMLERTVRDLLTDDIDEIVIDDPERHAELKANVEKFVGNDFQTKLILYNRPEPVFDYYKITKQVAEVFNRIVTLPSGGYLCIDETEALIAIDINTGKSRSAKEAPEMILATNLEAAEEIARQMRLRNIGGQVVIDFIDMSHQRDRDTVFKAMERFLRNDKARTKVLPISRFGLMELTRQRENESVKDAVYDLCPYCNGSGHVKSAISMSVEIQRALKEILKRKRKNKDFAVRVIMHPSIMARLKNNDADLLRELQNVYGKDLQFRADPTIHIEDFRLVDPETGLPVE
ncbi:MAG: Rne/Rng family ribonuclease [Lentisphaeria bacterium]|nr:Rne/Rng family ribonuclease [Lentisphaeria bacterium]